MPNKLIQTFFFNFKKIVKIFLKSYFLLLDSLNKYKMYVNIIVRLSCFVQQ